MCIVFQYLKKTTIRKICEEHCFKITSFYIVTKINLIINLK